MTIKIAINGYGRIGRNVLRALYESGRKDVQIVAVNDLGDAKINAHLTKHDTVHGPFQGTVAVDGGDLVVNGDRIKVFSERDPSKLPWGSLGIDVVLECTGIFRNKAKCQPHLDAGRQGAGRGDPVVGDQQHAVDLSDEGGEHPVEQGGIRTIANYHGATRRRRRCRAFALRP